MADEDLMTAPVADGAERDGRERYAPGPYGNQRIISTPAELVAAREARQLTQADISHRIRLQMRQVAALEQGQWDMLPGRAFVRGALRSYARYIDADVTPLIDSVGSAPGLPPLKRSTVPAATDSARQQGQVLDGRRDPSFGNGGSGRPIVWAIACLAGIVALVMYFGGDRPGGLMSWLRPGTAGPAGSTSTEKVPAERTADARTTASSASGASTSGEAGGNVAGTASEGAGTPASSSTGSSAASGAAGTSGPAGASPTQTGMTGTAAPGAGGAASAGATGTQPSAVGGASPTAAAAPAAANAPAPTAQAALQQGGQSGASSSVSSASQPGAQPGTQAAAQPVVVVPTASATARPPAAASAGESVYRFQTGPIESWVEVKQAEGGKVVIGRVVPANTTVDVTARPPLRVSVGKPSNVTYFHNGEKKDLKPHVKAHDIARIDYP